MKTRSCATRRSTQAYTLEYGDSVSPDAPPLGLAVAEDADVIPIGNIRFLRNASPLITSVKYRDEAIGTGLNGLIVSDSSEGETSRRTATAALSALIDALRPRILASNSARLMILTQFSFSSRNACQ